MKFVYRYHKAGVGSAVTEVPINLNHDRVVFKTNPNNPFLMVLPKIILPYLFSFLSVFLFSCESDPPPGMTDPGELIYYGYVNKQAQCSRCHGDEGQGGMFGPKIRGAVQKLGVDSVRAIIQNGRGKGDKRMPDFANELVSEQVEQVIAFLRTWEDTVGVGSIGVKANK